MNEDKIEQCDRMSRDAERGCHFGGGGREWSGGAFVRQ